MEYSIPYVWHVSHVPTPMSCVTCHMSFFLLLLFKASALRADAFYKSKCPSVCPSVCWSVCSLLRYRLNVFLPPLLEVRCPIFLEIWNSWGKIVERSGLRYENFCLKIVENCRAKKKFDFCWFCLTKLDGNHASRWIRDLWSKGVSLILTYL